MSDVIGSQKQIGRTLQDWVDQDEVPLTVDIAIQRDGGAWTTLYSGQTNGTSILWTVTGPAAAVCRLRYSNALNAVFTVYSANFSIVSAGGVVQSQGLKLSMALSL